MPAFRDHLKNGYVVAELDRTRQKQHVGGSKEYLSIEIFRVCAGGQAVA